MLYDKQGKPISVEEAGLLYQNQDYKHIRQDVIGQFRISTVWIGIDCANGFSGPPMIFETMVLPTDSWNDLYCERYSAEETTKVGHTKALYLVGLR
jgi:hypothetical protein